MRFLSLLILAACAPRVWETLPPPDETSHCVRYGGKRVVSHGLVMCVDHQDAGVEYVSHGGASFVRGNRERWIRKGPVAGTDPWGMHLAGWYDGNVRWGAWQFTDDRGVVRAEGQFFDGHRDGTWTIRYDNGQAASVVHYKNGSKDGPAQFWYRDGKPWWQGRYGWYKAVGTWQHWDPNGVRTDVDAEQGLKGPTGGRVDAVGPLAERSDFAGDNDRECAHDFVTIMWALEARPDVVSSTDGSTITFAWRGGRALGTIHEGGDAGDIVDENGEVVVRGDDREPECHDEGGRRVTKRDWWDESFP